MSILEMEQKNEKKFFCFKENNIWIGRCKFSQYWTGYLPSAVNVLKNTTKEIAPNTRWAIIQINFAF